MEQYLPSYLKIKNRQMLFELLRLEKSLSRTEIAKLTSMSFPTVIKTVDALLEKGVIEECSHHMETTGAGRRAYKLRFCPNSLLAVGIEFEGRYAKVGLVNMLGVVMCKEQLTIESFDKDKDLTPLAQSVDRLLLKYQQQQAKPATVLGIAIGFPANFNPETGEFISFKKMLISKKTPFGQVFPEFVSLLSLPLYLDNDVNLVCEGEAFIRANEMLFNNMMYISLGTGCGAACRINGKMFYGSNFMAGEIGRMKLCGYGDNSAEQPFLLEDIISLGALEQLFCIPKGGLSSIDTITSEKLCKYIAKPLATVIYNLASAMDIEMFILGGVISETLGEALCEETNKEISKAFCNSLPGAAIITVLPSNVQDAGIIGAASAVFDKEIDNFLES